MNKRQQNANDEATQAMIHSKKVRELEMRHKVALSNLAQQERENKYAAQSFKKSDRIDMIRLAQDQQARDNQLHYKEVLMEKARIKQQLNKMGYHQT